MINRMVITADERFFMETESGPIELDREIVYNESEKNTGKKPGKTPWVYFVGAIGIILVVALLFVSPDNGKFIGSPPPEEQAERDSIVAGADRIQQYLIINDSLPDPGDVSLPASFTYEKEDELLWSIETEDGLYYSSDMDLDSFGMGEI